MSIHPDLEWLARNVSEWTPGTHIGVPKDECLIYLCNISDEKGWCGPRSGAASRAGQATFTKAQWLQARQDLGLVMSEAEEQDYAPENPERSKYHREIKPGVWVDVYDVLHAWRVQNPALQHLIKKALAPGSRGHKDTETDLREILASAERAIQLEGFE